MSYLGIRAALDVGDALTLVGEAVFGVAAVLAVVLAGWLASATALAPGVSTAT
jgi:hypothetical protein